MYVNTHKYTHIIYVYAHRYVYIHTNIRVCILIYVEYTHIQTNIRIYIQIYVYIDCPCLKLTIWECFKIKTIIRPDHKILLFGDLIPLLLFFMIGLAKPTFPGNPMMREYGWVGIIPNALGK